MKSMLLKIVSASIWFRRGLYLPMLITLIVTLALIGAVGMVESSFNKIVDQEMKKYGANVILIPDEKTQLDEENVPVYLKTVEYNGQEVGVAITQIAPLLKMNPAWVVKGEPGILVGEALAEKYKIRMGDAIKLGEREGAAAILKTGTEFDSLFVMEGKVEKASMILIQSDNPEKYAGQNAIILRELVLSKFFFLTGIKKLMLYVALITAIASIIAIVNLARVDAGSRRREFGILKALGAGQKTIGRLMVMEFAFVSIFSGILGLIMSTALAAAIILSVARIIPVPNLKSTLFVFSTAIISFGMAFLIYWMESRKQEVYQEMKGD